MSDTYFLIFGIIVTLIGISLIVIHFRDIFSCRECTFGKITKLKVEKTTLRGSTVSSYRPEFTYTVNDKSYNGIASFSSHNKDKYKVGDDLNICYSSKKPERYRMKGKCKSLTFGIVITAIGLLFVVLYFV